VDGLTGSLGTIYAGFAAATEKLGSETQGKLFAGNARRIYRL
jgi:predicted TIM-barrel fold metal-dependent hydrolase